MAPARIMMATASAIFALMSIVAGEPKFFRSAPPPPAPSLRILGWGEWTNNDINTADAGHTWYTRIMDMFGKEQALANLGAGMGATWIRRGPCADSSCGSTVGDSNTTCACPAQCGAQGNRPAGWLMQSMEGGPGYFSTQGSLPSRHAKWRIGDSVGCYEAYTGSPMFQFGAYAGHACSLADVDKVQTMGMGFVQLSNRLVMFPDGITFEPGQGMLGVGYVRTPLGKINSTDNNRSFWTVVLDAENFAGPLGYFLPEFWKQRARGWENETANFPDFGTVPSIAMSGGAFEMDSIPTFNSSDGNLKLPRASMPLQGGRTVLFRGSAGHSNGEIVTPLEHALAAAAAKSSSNNSHINQHIPVLDVSKLLNKGQPHSCNASNSTAYILDGKAGIGTLVRGRESGGECVWSLHPFNESCCGDMDSCELTGYLDGNTMLPLTEDKVAPSLRAAKFPTASPAGPYDLLSAAAQPPAGGCRDHPGPASMTVYCAKTTSPTWVAWRWYKFSDQPGIQQALKTDAERAFIQARVENLHKMMPGTTSRWIKQGGAAAQGRISIDKAAVITKPPQGFEFGYVPIVLYEGLEKPKECQQQQQQQEEQEHTEEQTEGEEEEEEEEEEIVSQKEVAKLQMCPPVPPAKTCTDQCLRLGHCCAGDISNDGLPSCAQGCIIANYTDSKETCQTYCRTLALHHNCTWSIGNHTMTSCGPRNCPVGCSAIDGPYECEAGCQFAHNLPPQHQL